MPKRPYSVTRGDILNAETYQFSLASEFLHKSSVEYFIMPHLTMKNTEIPHNKTGQRSQS